MEKQPPGPHPDDHTTAATSVPRWKIKYRRWVQEQDERNTQAPQTKYQTQKVNTTQTTRGDKDRQVLRGICDKHQNKEQTQRSNKKVKGK